jgi:hypothetical protein
MMSIFNGKFTQEDDEQEEQDAMDIDRKELIELATKYELIKPYHTEGHKTSVLNKLEAFAKAYQAAINNKGDYKEYSQEDAPANYQHAEAFAWASGAMHGYVEGYQAAAPIDNVTKNRGNESECAAVLPNGKTCTNVYEAYDIGMIQAFEQAAIAMQPMLRDMISRGDAYRIIRALIPTQAKKGE